MVNHNLKISLFFSFVALCLLLPGITQPVLSLQGAIEKSKLADVGIEMLAQESDSRTRRMLNMVSNMLGLDELEGEVQVYQKTRSIWGTISELSRNQNYLVALLVAFFSIVIPVFKLLCQSLYVFVSMKNKKRLEWIILLISKWSMADVFVIAIIVAYLAGNADGQMGELLIMQAHVGSGFWFFTSYCLVSIASSYFVSQDMKMRALNFEHKIATSVP